MDSKRDIIDDIIQDVTFSIFAYYIGRKVLSLQAESRRYERRSEDSNLSDGGRTDTD